MKKEKEWKEKIEKDKINMLSIINKRLVFIPKEAIILLRNLDNSNFKVGKDYFFRIKLGSDTPISSPIITKNEMIPQWNDEIHFLLTDPNIDSLVFEMMEEEKDFPNPYEPIKIGEASVPIEGLSSIGSGIADFVSLGQLHFLDKESDSHKFDGSIKFECISEMTFFHEQNLSNSMQK